MSNYVYFMKHPHSGQIKIGYSKHPEKRRKQIERDMGVKGIKILGTIKDVPLERRLHKRFADYRQNGEWFQPTDELREYVAKNNGRPDLGIAKVVDMVKDTIADVKDIADEEVNPDAVYVIIFIGVLFVFGGMFLYSLLVVEIVDQIANFIRTPTKPNFIEAFALIWLLVGITVGIPLMVKLMQMQAESEHD